MVYLIHFQSKLHHAQHYIGFTEVDERQTERIEISRPYSGELMAMIKRLQIGYKILPLDDNSCCLVCTAGQRLPN